jgi:hypothetical protein
VDFLPNGFRLLKDEEIIPKDCFCFGNLENGNFGWGRPPIWLVGQPFCDGWCHHPSFIAVKHITTKYTGGNFERKRDNRNDPRI